MTTVYTPMIQSLVGQTIKKANLFNLEPNRYSIVWYFETGSFTNNVRHIIPPNFEQFRRLEQQRVGLKIIDIYLTPFGNSQVIVLEEGHISITTEVRDSANGTSGENFANFSGRNLYPIVEEDDLPLNVHKMIEEALQ